MLTFVSSNIVSRCVFSHKIKEEDGCSKFGELVKRLMVLFTSFCFGDMFPYLSWADVLTGFVPSMKALSSDLDAFFDQVIKEHRALGEKKDFVSIIMQLQKDGLFENLTQDNIKAILLVISTLSPLFGFLSPFFCALISSLLALIISGHVCWRN
ncbi:hypothetical protein V6N13_103681 [Hibiscus sabdariffa]